MRKIIVQEFVTVDGVAEDPGGATSFALGGWQRPYYGKQQEQRMTAQAEAVDALLLGRATYDDMAASWPDISGLGGLADRMNTMPKWVASTTADDLTWNATMLEGDAIAAIRTLREDDAGDLLVVGSIGLAQSLLAADLVDEIRLWVHPLVLGAGRRLFADDQKLELELVGAESLDTGVVIQTYQR